MCDGVSNSSQGHMTSLTEVWIFSHPLSAIWEHFWGGIPLFCTQTSGQRGRSPVQVTHSLRQLTVSAGTDRGSLWVSIQHGSPGTGLGGGGRVKKGDPQSAFSSQSQKKKKRCRQRSPWWIRSETTIKDWFNLEDRRCLMASRGFIWIYDWIWWALGARPAWRLTESIRILL